MQTTPSAHFSLSFLISFPPRLSSNTVAMAEQGEIAFVKSFVNALSAQPIVYGNNYQPAPENELKKVPVLPVSRCHHAVDTSSLSRLPFDFVLMMVLDSRRSTFLHPQNGVRLSRDLQVCAPPQLLSCTWNPSTACL